MTGTSQTPRSRTLLAQAVLLLSTAILGLLVLPSAQAATWSSIDKWATYSDGGYTIRNDVWGSGAGPQTIWAKSYKNWGVHADHPGGGGVRAYPQVAQDIGKRLGEISELTSSFAVKVPSGGVHNTAYDIWANGQDYEIMVWMTATGGAAPLGPAVRQADVGGHSWTIHRGSNGSTKATISFVSTSNSTSGTVDLLAILKYIQSQGWYGDVTVGDVQFGWEISASDGGMDFEVTDYELNAR